MTDSTPIGPGQPYKNPWGLNNTWYYPNYPGYRYDYPDWIMMTNGANKLTEKPEPTVEELKAEIKQLKKRNQRLRDVIDSLMYEEEDE